MDVAVGTARAKRSVIDAVTGIVIHPRVADTKVVTRESGEEIVHAVATEAADMTGTAEIEVVDETAIVTTVGAADIEGATDHAAVAAVAAKVGLIVEAAVAVQVRAQILMDLGSPTVPRKQTRNEMTQARPSARRI